MPNARNIRTVEMLKEELGDAQTFFLVDYQGLSAEDLGQIRTDIRNAGGRVIVTKNTLINVVLESEGVEGFDELLTGPTALIVTGDDVVAPVKTLVDFAKKHPKKLPVPKGGRLEGTLIGEDGFERISKLPSREEAQSQLVGVLIAPVQQLVGVLEGPQRNFVTVVNNYADKLKEEA